MKKYEAYVKSLYEALGGKGFDTNADMQALLKSVNGLGPVGNSHDGPNEKMHEWFVGYFGDRAPLYGYDPREDHAVYSEFGEPNDEDFNGHLDKVGGILEK